MLLMEKAGVVKARVVKARGMKAGGMKAGVVKAGGVKTGDVDVCGSTKVVPLRYYVRGRCVELRFGPCEGIVDL